MTSATFESLPGATTNAISTSTNANTPATTPSILDMHLTILPHRLHFVQLQCRQLQRSMYALLKVFLEMNASRFYSFTQTSKEITLILDEDGMGSVMDAFNQLSTITGEAEPPYTTTSNVWRAIQCMEGDSGSSPFVSIEDPNQEEFDTTAYQPSTLVTNVSRILASNSISIYYLSTYQTDFVLVQEQELERALNALALAIDRKDAASVNRRQIVEDFSAGTGNLGTVRTESETTTIAQIPNPQPLSSTETPNASAPPLRLRMNVAPPQLYVLNLKLSDIQAVCQSLITCMFYGSFPSSSANSSAIDAPLRFFSYSEIEGFASAIVDKSSLLLITTSPTLHNPLPPPLSGGFYYPNQNFNLQSSFDEEAELPDDTCWQAFCIDGKFGFDEVGMVYTLSSPLTNARIAPFYISTFSTDYVLVSSRNYKQSLDILANCFEFVDH
jgi:hypothetical protein